MTSRPFVPSPAASTFWVAVAWLSVVPLVISLPAPVHAETVIKEDATHPGDFSLYGIIGWNRAGAGMQWAIPVAPKGFIPRVNDAFFVEFGVEFGVWSPYWSYGWVGVSPIGGVRYQFYITKVFAPFVAVKGGVTFDLFDDTTWVVHPYIEPEIGFQLTFTPRFAMRFGFDLDGVDIGVSWMFK